MDFQAFCTLYSLGSLRSAAPIRSGTTAQIWKLETAQGVFLLRTLSGPAQGELEWAIARHLLQKKVCRVPAILPAAGGVPWAELGGTYFQVQAFCPGERPSLSRPGTAGKIAETAVRLAGALSHFVPPHAMPDRFDLASVWAAHRQNWPQLELPLSLAQADARVAALSALPWRDPQLIHGDLGLWNMLEQDGEITVIDFGEARLGDPYFDLAAALGGVINHSEAARSRENAAEFLAVCRQFIPLDTHRLLEQISVWNWRGLAQCVRAPQAWKRMAQRFYHAIIWCEENFDEL